MIDALQILTDDTCYAGIWKSWFLKGLLWRLQAPEWDLYVLKPKPAHKVENWRAPSWSFASVEGVVLYSLIENAVRWDYCAELEECQVNPKGRNPLGELESGFIKIKGPITSIVEISDEKVRESTTGGRACKIQMRLHVLAECSVYFDIDSYDSCDVLMITPRTGIVITQADTNKDTYVRVGVLSVHRIWDGITEPGQFNPTDPEYLDRSISAANYPEPTSITLL